MNDKMMYIFKRVCDEYEGAKLGKKASQKIFYFIERAGIDLRLRYTIHYYGPYSQKLSYFIDELELDGDISIDDSEKTHAIKWISNDPLPVLCTKQENEIITEVLRKYGNKKPSELEALSTMDYVANTLLKKDEKNKEHILDYFLRIKGRKFSIDEANEFYTELYGDMKE